MSRRERVTVPLARCSPTWPCSHLRSVPRATPAQLRGVRNFDARRFKHGDALLDAIQVGLDLPPERNPATAKETRQPSPTSTGVISLCLAWLAQRGVEGGARHDGARHTRRRHQPRPRCQPSRLSSGWRDELVGRELSGIIDGSVALRVNGTELELVDRTPS